MRAHEFLTEAAQARYDDVSQYKTPFAYKIAGSESGYRNIPNQTGSSATGLYQITRGTYNSLARQARPGDPLYKTSFDQMQRDVSLQHAAMDRLEQAYDSSLARNKIPATDANKYMLHFFGPTGIQILKNPDRKLEDFLDPGVFKVNPNLKPGMRGADVHTALDVKMSDKKTADRLARTTPGKTAVDKVAGTTTPADDEELAVPDQRKPGVAAAPREFDVGTGEIARGLDQLAAAQAPVMR